MFNHKWHSLFLPEIPVFPTVTAKVTFQQFSWEDNIPEHKFVIPQNYREDPYRFPDLWYCLELTLIHVLTSLRCLNQEEVGGDTDSALQEVSGSTCMDLDVTPQLPLVAMDVPLTNLGDSSAQMTLLF